MLHGCLKPSEMPLLSAVRRQRREAASAGKAASACDSKHTPSRKPRVLKFGSDFSGLDSAWLALGRLGVTSEFCFASDTDKACRKLLQTHGPKRLFGDVLERRPEEEEVVHLYMTTPPCQSWSTLGKRHGIDDKRGRVMAASAKYIYRNRPRVVLMENVKNITCKKNLPFLKGFARSLRQMGYTVWGRILNAQDFQVAQDRKRFFMVAILTQEVRTPFRWPAATGKRTLDMVLDRPRSSDRAGRLPSNTDLALKLAASAFKKAFQAGFDPRRVPVAVDIDCTERFATYGINICRTLTRTRGAQLGFWLSSRGRKMSIHELMAVTGVSPSELPTWRDLVTEKQLGGMLGNSVPVPLIQAVLRQALLSAGLL